MKCFSVFFLSVFIFFTSFSQSNEELYDSFNFEIDSIGLVARHLKTLEWNLDSTYYYSYGDESWNLNEKNVVESKDDRGNHLEVVNYHIGADSVWQNFSKLDYSYHENDVFKTSLKHLWKNGSWGDTISYNVQTDENKRLLELYYSQPVSRKILYEYDAANLLQYRKELQKSNQSSWIHINRTSFFYNADSKRIRVLHEIFQNSQYVKQQLDTLIYENGILISEKRYRRNFEEWVPERNVIYGFENEDEIITSQNWDPIAEEWKNTSRRHIFITDDVFQGFENFVWDGNSWIPSRRIIYSYRDDDRLSSILSEKWNTATNIYDKKSSTIFDWLDTDKILIKTTRRWNNDSWNNSRKVVSFWTEKDYHVATTLFSKDTYKIYPNPSSDFIQVKGMNENVNSKIYSIDGKWMMDGIGNQIDVSRLIKGGYVLKTDDGFVGKFVKK